MNLKEVKNLDLVISSLSIHHQKEADKRKLFKNIFRSLKYGGIFINADQIKGETPFLRKLYRDIWLKKIRMNGASKKKIEESVKRRKKYDVNYELKSFSIPFKFSNSSKK